MGCVSLLVPLYLVVRVGPASAGVFLMDGRGTGSTVRWPRERGGLPVSKRDNGENIREVGPVSAGVCPGQEIGRGRLYR